MFFGTLTGQAIKDTYDGLLKLADSTTGITQNLQQIQDGLGNDTGIRITTNQLEVPNIMSFIRLKGQYYGNGITSGTGTQMAAGTQNTIIAIPFYDSGLYSYSAMSYNLGTLTTSTDTVEAAFYTSQLINPFGLYPHAPVISAITITTTGSTGIKTTTFASNLSFSGYGGGIYWLVYKVSNANVQPTVRYGNPQTNRLALTNESVNAIYGMVSGFTANNLTTSRYNGSGSQWYVFSGASTFDNPYSTNITTLQSTTANVTGSSLGFTLNTTDY